MARHIVQLILTSTRILCRAFVKSVQEEIRAAQEASKKQTINRYTEAGTGVKSFREITLEEAKQILNVQELKYDEVNSKFNHLFQVNDKHRGGSLYLQSKVFRAKERIDKELQFH